MKMLRGGAAVFVAAMVVVALAGVSVSSQTHHVLGVDGGLDVGSWLSGRVFRVGDKLWFNCSGTDDIIVELEGPEEFHTCDLRNPIKMYTDPVAHVELDKEGTRYFASGNQESCRNGLKLNPSVVPPPPPRPRPPSAANHLNGPSFVLLAVLFICFYW